MNGQKRYRQISIFDSFAANKKQRINNMDSNGVSQIRDLMLSAAEKRMTSPCAISFPMNQESVESDDSVIVIKGNDNAADSAPLENDNCSEEIGGSSEELFTDQPSSLEDHCIPSSSELFVEEEDSEPLAASAADSDDDDDTEEEDQVVLLNRIPTCSISLPKLEPLPNHFIMFSPHIRPGDAPRPYPPSYRDRWGSDHVRMPCSPENRYPVEDRTGEKRIESRWDLICASLSADIETSLELEEAIMSYNSQYAGKWNFQGFHAFFNKHMAEEEQVHFFEDVLPAMVEMALKLPTICTQPVPLLKRGRDRRVTLSQKQIGCLLLNAFFCTFPRRTLTHKRGKQRWTCEYASYPDINFNRLFAGVKNDICSRNAEKLKCLINYFRRITSKEPSGTVTFHRQCLQASNLPKWDESTRGIRTAVIKSGGVIETEGHGMLQVDFANKFVGGGVLGFGCVQEEIRFIICPELIVSRLFVECLDRTEVMIVTGVEQYSRHSGYADNFKFEGNFIDTTLRDSWGRRYTQLMAMDATHFRNSDDQFKPQLIIKELNKAYSGFYENAPPRNLPAVATGNWGCGAFKGNPNLKFLIQLMAASEAGRSLVYFTFGNKKLKTELRDMYNFLIDKNLAVGDVWRLLMDSTQKVSEFRTTKCCELYDSIYAQFFTKEENYRQQEPEEETQSLDDSDKRVMEKHIEDVTSEGFSSFE